MMATTHAFVGLLLAVAVNAVAPEFGLVAAIAGLAGGTFPDLDLAAVHRKTLHFPVWYSVATVPAAVAALVSPSPMTVGVAVFLAAAAIHSASDALGGGLELRPWEATSTRAVYIHPLKRWVEPRRYIRYDGAPEDFAVGAVFAVPGLLVFDGLVRQLVVGGLLVSFGYTVIRKQLPRITPERFR
ncbi:metal-dependent hydrolase [Haloarchaeobius sp. HME9146]|uniref:metal-dependent hydrolase n=1 Tax=Haloarchaeobius sp. HME9146 TaxID=2978732 RepID=UPI0021BE7D5A|nr:metal-dependent hydrolase [Haloarchaeobius sp. HME9146]MCT9095501.1 metal-dependent hydrolase [Haloarchaeobius sp. HME9146]